VRIRSLATTAAAAALALTTGLLPAYAGTTTGTFTISAAPTSLHPGETTAVTGDATGPACADDGVVVTLSYTRPNGATGTISVNATTDSAGHFTANITVPDNAVADEPASVVAVIADCTPPSGPTETRQSNSAALTIRAYDGTFTTDKNTGHPGDTVHVAGTTCYGGSVEVTFGRGGTEQAVTVTLKPDRTFAGTFVLPNAPSGTYVFNAHCPGTNFPARPLALVNVAPAQPPTPIPGGVTVTG
jgi:hypothetical protein